jgi:hypothetical protein
MLFEERQARKNNRRNVQRRNESAKTASDCLNMSRIWPEFGADTANGAEAADFRP